MRVFMYQCSGRFLDVAGNLEDMDRVARACAVQGGELVIFPELFLCGYNIGDDAPRVAQTVDGDAIDRARRYVAAGADWIFPEALVDEGEFAQFAKAVPAPLVANMTEFGKSKLLPFATFQKLKYAAVLYPVTLLRIAMKAVDEALAEISASGTQAQLLERMQSRQELYDLIEYKEYEARDRAYFSGPGKS